MKRFLTTAGFLACTATYCFPARAQTVALLGKESITTSASVSGKPWRFFWEDGFSLGVSYDLNPKSRSVIAYPHISTLAWLGPEVGINLRTPGSRYAALGLAKNPWIAEPIVRLSYGQQWRRSFVEVGLIAFPSVGSNLSGEWQGPRVIPRVSLGTRF